MRNDGAVASLLPTQTAPASRTSTGTGVRAGADRSWIAFTNPFEDGGADQSLSMLVPYLPFEDGGADQSWGTNPWGWNPFEGDGADQSMENFWVPFEDGASQSLATFWNPFEDGASQSLATFWNPFEG